MNSLNEIKEELKPKNINFVIDVFEKILLMDVAEMSDSMKQKLYRDLTPEFETWINEELSSKKQIKIAIKGRTRSGKSLIGLKILKKVTDYYDDKTFNTENQVCGNQKELRQKLQNVEFGDSFLIDENAFSSAGLGSMTEVQQLKDINNIIAKNNNHMIYITPEVFLNVGASYGLQFYGRDNKNWLSRFLLFSLNNGMPTLLGYVIFNIGSLFQETGCFIYHKTGGCTNPNRINLKDIDNKYIKNSSCIPKNYNVSELAQDNKTCPFYNICKSQMLKYEHKKDKWIEKEMKGGLNERDFERFEIALKLFINLYDEETGKLKASSGKELKLKIKLKLPSMTSTKFTGTELEEIIQTTISLKDEDFKHDVCSQLEIDYEKFYEKYK